MSYLNDCDFSFYRGAFGYRQEFGANATLSRVLSSLLQQTRSKLALDANDHMCNLCFGILKILWFFSYVQITWQEAIN